MSISNSYAVFGLGRYVSAVAKELLDNGAPVLAVEKNSKIVDDMAEEIPVCKCADITDPGVIKQLGISNIDVVIIAMAESFEASVMATMLCKEAGVKKVIVKCANESHCHILKKIGADEVVVPECESGIRLAKNILSSGFIDIVDISDNVSILEIETRPEWCGKTLRELELRKKYNINVLAVKSNGVTDVTFHPDDVITENMKMIVMADKQSVDHIK